jgi:hypothetical protein
MFPLRDVPAPARPFTHASQQWVYTWTARCVQVLAQSRVFSALGEEPETSAALAARTGCNADALERMMRLLASFEIFERLEDGRYRHNAISRGFDERNAVGASASLRLQGSPLFLSALTNLDVTLRTGGPSLAAIAPKGLWAYLAEHAEESRLYDATMSGQSAAANIGVLEAFDFSRYGEIADIAGGQGQTLRAILDATPNANGVLFDLPRVLAGAPAHPRIRTLSGDFLKDDLPTGCDAYILKMILHDWPDEQAAKILAAVRKAARPGAKLFVIESVRSEEPDFDFSLILDISMLALVGGRERTPAEFSALFAKTGFKLTRTVPTTAIVSIVEAEAV